MPTYEYRCLKCQKTFDAVQSMKDERFTTCPEALCKNETGWAHGEVTRLLGTGAGLIFKGSGFYITDYRSENYKQGAKKDAPAPAGGGEGSGGAKTGDAGAGGKPATPATTPAKPAPAAPPPSTSPKSS